MTLDYLKEIKNIHCYCNILFLSLFVFSYWPEFKNASRALEPFKDENRNSESLLNWIQRSDSYQIYGYL